MFSHSSGPLDHQCQVLNTLQRLADIGGSPAFIRSDNGSEFIAHIIQDWCHLADVQTLYIEPGSPWQNPFIESFHSRFRDECLNPEIFFLLRKPASSWKIIGTFTMENDLIVVWAIKLQTNSRTI
jgi:transposase InsO family protein